MASTVTLQVFTAAEAAQAWQRMLDDDTTSSTISGCSDITTTTVANDTFGFVPLPRVIPWEIGNRFARFTIPRKDAAVYQDMGRGPLNFTLQGEFHSTYSKTAAKTDDLKCMRWAIENAYPLKLVSPVYSPAKFLVMSSLRPVYSGQVPDGIIYEIDLMEKLS